jgi:hypothetical protein
MAHHKRHRPKNRRAGCLLCKPWKANGFARRTRADGERFTDHRRRLIADTERRKALAWAAADRSGADPGGGSLAALALLDRQ